MFNGISKGRLVFWSLLWAALAVICWQVDTPVLHLLAIAFLITALALLSASKRKADRDAYHRQLNSLPTTYPANPPTTSPESQHFGPPPALDK